MTIPISTTRHSKSMVLLFSLVILGAGSLFLYSVLSDPAHISKSVYTQMLTGIMTPNSDSLAPHASATNGPENILNDVAVLSLLATLFTGFYSAVFSRFFQSAIDRILLSTFVSLGVIGFITIALSLTGLLYQDILLPVIASIAIGLNVSSFKKIKSIGRLTFRTSDIRNLVSTMVKLDSPTIIVTLCLTFSISFVYATILPVIDFDSLIYHAEIAKILFDEHSFPTFRGPSVGIEISGNYPPLFSAIAAGLYILFGKFDDVFLRILPPIFGLMVLWGTAKISDSVFPGSAKYAAIALLSTPLFVHSLIIPSTTLLYAAGIISSIVCILQVSSDQSEKRSVASKKLAGYAILAGVFMGFALLSSYQALFYAAVPALALLAIRFRNKKSTFGAKQSLPLLLTIFVAFSLLTATMWYARNAHVHGNPFYPWLMEQDDDANQYELLFSTTKKEIQTVGSFVTFGQFDHELLDGRTLFRNHPLLFPVFSVISVIGMAILLYHSRRNVWLVLWALIPLILILSLGTIFPRYLVPLLAGLAVSFGALVAFGLDRAEKLSVGFTARRSIKLSILGLLLTMYILIGLPVALANPAVNMGDYPDRFLFMKNLDEPEVALRAFYLDDVDAWEWLRKNTSAQERVATFDPRIYYMGNYRSVLALDGYDSLPLYSTKGIDEAKEYLEKNNVKYIFDAGTSKSSLWKKLPLTEHLGSDDFPETASFGSAKIYRVN